MNLYELKENMGIAFYSSKEFKEALAKGIKLPVNYSLELTYDSIENGLHIGAKIYCRCPKGYNRSVFDSEKILEAFPLTTAIYPGLSFEVPNSTIVYIHAEGVDVEGVREPQIVLLDEDGAKKPVVSKCRVILL